MTRREQPHQPSQLPPPPSGQPVSKAQFLMPDSMEGFFGPPIDTYTRADALRDDVLVDITATAHEAGFRLPVAVTHGVWEAHIAWTDEDDARKPGACQDQEGRLWDVAWMASCGARRNRTRSSFYFDLLVVPREGGGVRARKVTLLCDLGSGDDGRPVVTIALDSTEL